MKTILSILLVFVSVLTLSADEKEKLVDNNRKAVTVTVFGNVTDADSGETLVGVQVQLEGSDQKVYTDFDGNFSFENVLPGKYNITADYISYEHKKIEKQNIDIFSGEVQLKLNPVK